MPSDYHVSSSMAKIVMAYIFCQIALQLFIDDGFSNSARSIMCYWLRLPEMINAALLILFAGAVVVMALVLLIFSMFEVRCIVHVTDANMF